MSTVQMDNTVNLVWFKRDLRLTDHRPLYEAAKSGHILPLYVVEEGYWGLDTVSSRHRQFALQSVKDLGEQIKQLGGRLLVVKGEVTEVLTELYGRYSFKAMYSHEETGNGWTYGRDLAVKDWCRNMGVVWHESQSNGVVRRLASRDGWAGLWNKTMNESLKEVKVFRFASVTGPETDAFDAIKNEAIQVGGREEALTTLNSFLELRGRSYRGGISSPLSAVEACSRLSPYLSVGSLSIREVFQKLQQRVTFLKEQPPATRKGWLGSLKDFQSRLYWHCHFIQKLELMPSLEFNNIHSAYNGLRENSFDEVKFNAWKEGRTGYPFLDACMRYLNKHGWINFRMRAMLVSFAANNLWLHWRPLAKHLGRMFTDYEPGIHYSQIQMQSGTTGINAPRIYNPVKQSTDHDPAGVFIRRHVEELKNVADEFIHTPWQLPENDFNKLDYVKPVVDHIKTCKEAKSRLFGVRKTPGFKEQCAYISNKIASRKKN